jgi:hypothetical protein
MPLLLARLLDSTTKLVGNAGIAKHTLKLGPRMVPLLGLRPIAWRARTSGRNRPCRKSDAWDVD